MSKVTRGCGGCRYSTPLFRPDQAAASLSGGFNARPALLSFDFDPPLPFSTRLVAQKLPN